MKKKSLLPILALFLVAAQVSATADSMYDYMRKIDNNYYVVVGLNGKSGDSFAAADIVVALKKELNRDIEPTIENLIHPGVNKILIGHPCDNSLIQGLSCEYWPYEEGVAIIKIIGNDLVIAGSTVDDTRRAAKIVAHFKEFPELKQHKEILVLGNTLDIEQLTLRQVTKEADFVCGDNICELGEKHLCAIDCAQTSCFKLCQRQGFVGASCRDPPSNPNLPFCPEGETNQGLSYCAGGKACCCKNPSPPSPEQETTPTPTVEVKEESIFTKILRWIKEFFSVLF